MLIWLVTGSAAVLAQLGGSGLQGPTPVNLPSWASGSGMPDYLFDGASSSWAIRARLTVRPDGKVQRCEIEIGTNNRELDKFTCEMFERRATFRPAVWTDGKPSFGVFRLNFVWARRHTRLNKWQLPDLSIRVAESIYGQRTPAAVCVVVAVDPNGRISDCSNQPSFDSDVESNLPALVPFACEEVIRRYHPRPARDDAGNPVRSVQNAFVIVRSK